VEPYRERIEDFLRRWRRWRSQYEGDRVIRVLVITVVLAALGVTLSGLQQTPTYEASAQVWVDQKPGDQQTYVTESGQEIKTLPPGGEGLQAIIQVLLFAIDSRPVAEKAVERLGLQREPVGRLGPMGAAELLDNLTVEQVEHTSFIVLTYEDTDPVRAQRIVNTVGEVSSELISKRSSAFRATVVEKAALPESPVSPRPLRNGLLTLVIGLVLCVGTVVALPGVGARVVGSLGERPSRQGIGQAGVLGRRHSAPSIVERVKEKELLRALGRRGKLTAVEAALESELSVDEANRILEELAFAGHLEVTAEHGKLLYSFWGEHDRAEEA
jgi:capsular polysaccharide biosynthesis protein